MTKLYKDEEGFMVEVHEITDPVRFCAQGGGFVHHMSLRLFLEEFQECGPPGFRKAQFTGDWLPDGFGLDGYTNGMRWNGWEIPYFELHAAARLLEHDTSLHYDLERDAFWAEREDGKEYFPTSTIEAAGAPVKVYQIGDGWCWGLA